jgi:pantoate--beta-alanine ligase
VATVCTKLFGLVRPARAYFGRKDAQQALLVRRMVRDLLLDIEIVVCPIVRETDGLAVSSRNAHLSPGERKQATCLHRALGAAQEALAGGETDAMNLIQTMAETVIAEERAELDYAAIVDPEDLEDVTTVDRACMAALAVWFGGTRLIDNAMLVPPEKG